MSGMQRESATAAAATTTLNIASAGRLYVATNIIESHVHLGDDGGGGVEEDIQADCGYDPFSDTSASRWTQTSAFICTGRRQTYHIADNYTRVDLRVINEKDAQAILSARDTKEIENTVLKCLARLEWKGADIHSKAMTAWKVQMKEGMNQLQQDVIRHILNKSDYRQLCRAVEQAFQHGMMLMGLDSGSLVFIFHHLTEEDAERTCSSSADQKAVQRILLESLLWWVKEEEVVWEVMPCSSSPAGEGPDAQCLLGDPIPLTFQQPGNVASVDCWHMERAIERTMQRYLYQHFSRLQQDCLQRQTEVMQGFMQRFMAEFRAHQGPQTTSHWAPSSTPQTTSHWAPSSTPQTTSHRAPSSTPQTTSHWAPSSAPLSTPLPMSPDPSHDLTSLVADGGSLVTPRTPDLPPDVTADEKILEDDPSLSEKQVDVGRPLAKEKFVHDGVSSLHVVKQAQKFPHSQSACAAWLISSTGRDDTSPEVQYDSGSAHHAPCVDNKADHAMAFRKRECGEQGEQDGQEPSSLRKRAAGNMGKHQLQESTPLGKQATGNMGKHQLQESTPLGKQATGNMGKHQLQESTPLGKQAAGNMGKHQLQESTPFGKQAAGNMGKHQLQESTPLGKQATGEWGEAQWQVSVSETLEDWKRGTTLVKPGLEETSTKTITRHGRDGSMDKKDPKDKAEWKEKQETEDDSSSSAESKMADSLRKNQPSKKLQAEHLLTWVNVKSRASQSSDPEIQRLMEQTEIALQDEERESPKARALDTVLVLDTSDSVVTQHLDELKTVTHTFIDGIEDNVDVWNLEENLAVVQMGSRAWVRQHLTNDYSRVRDAVDAVMPDSPTMPTGGRTSMFQALMVCLGAIEGKGGVVNVAGCHRLRPRIVFFTDGRATDEASEFGSDVQSNVSEVKYSLVQLISEFASKKHKTTPSPIFWVPIGNNSDLPFMESLAALSGGKVVEKDNVDELCRYYKMQETIGCVYKMVCNHTDLYETEQQIRSIVNALAGTLNDAEKDYVMEEVRKKQKDPEHEITKANDFDDVFEDRDQVNMGVLLPLGTRVRRGQDWKWTNQDSDGPGTVIQHRKKQDGWLYVMWDNGVHNAYRYNEEGRDVERTDTDLRILLLSQVIEIGVIVKRGEDWKSGDEDGNGTGIVIRTRKDGKVKVRWENGHIGKYKFGAHDLKEVAVAEECLPRQQAVGGGQTAHEAELGATGGYDPEKGPVRKVWQWWDYQRKVWRTYSHMIQEKLLAAYQQRPDGSCVIVRNGKSRRVLFKMNQEKAVDKGGGMVIVRTLVKSEMDYVKVLEEEEDED